ncbi:MAG: type sorting protein [Bacteroidetes bacterium]|nr:type sorting protein [Bacteroidota bacterium]
MKKITVLIMVGLFSLFGATRLKAQWVQKSNFGGSARSGGAGFTLGNKIYFVGGQDNFPNQDVWEYDATGDTWTQKATFPGGFRTGASTFTIGTKAYVGLGNNSNLYFNDLWEYDQSTDTWTQKAFFPGDGREQAVGFSIGGKGYMGTGLKYIINPNNTTSMAFSDFYEYDPITDQWTQKASIPGSSRCYATGAATGTKGYLGFGADADQSVSYTDFYEYDPSADTWTAKSTGAGYPVADAGMLIIGTDLYLVGGLDFSNFTAPISYRKYNTLTDTWSTPGNFSGGIIASPVAVSVNGKGYAGTGFDSNLDPRNDWWELTPVTSTLTTGVDEVKSIQKEFSIGPNPVKSKLHVDFQKSGKGDYYYTITSILGQTISQGTISSEGNVLLPETIKEGIYTITVYDASHRKMGSVKFVKN